MAKSAKLNVKIDGDARGLNRALGKVEQRAKRFGDKMKGAMKKAGLIAGTVGGAGIAIGVREISKAAEHYDKIGKLSTRFKISTTSLQKLHKAAGLSGTSIETVARGMSRLIKSTREAQKNPKGTMAQAFKDLNLEMRDLARLTPDERLAKVAAAFRNAEDRQKAFAAVLQLMGRSADELIPLFESMAKANKTGRILSEKDIRAIEQFNDAIFDFKMEVMALAGQAIPKMVEGFKEAKSILDKIGTGAWRMLGLDVIKEGIFGKKEEKEEAPMAPIKHVVGNASSGEFSGLDAMIDMQRRRHGDMRFARGGRFKQQRHFFNEIDPVFGPPGGGRDPIARMRSKPLVTDPGQRLEGAGMSVHPKSKLGRAIRAGEVPPGTTHQQFNEMRRKKNQFGAVGGLSGKSAFRSIREAEAKKEKEEAEKRMSPEESLTDIAESNREILEEVRPSP